MERHAAQQSAPAPARPEALFDGRALPFALGGIALAIITARAVSFLLRQTSLPVAVYFLVFWTLVFGGLWLTSRYLSRRFGSGNPWSDFGFAWRPSDLWRGAAAYLVAGVVINITTAPWVGHTGRLDHLTEGIRHVSWPAFAVFACSAVVAAPVFEELAFRGMLQRTLASRVGPSRAIAGQAVVFGAYHMVPQLGWDNVPYAVGLICFGLVIGWLAGRVGRLGPGCTAHVIANTLGVIARAGSR